MKKSQLDKALEDIEGQIAVLEAAAEVLRDQKKQAPVRRVASSAVAKVVDAKSDLRKALEQ